ncbi:hypothetical protein F8388_015586 [Cannabis sativa]|nr:hypothetical protein F8388_015586 [Cannabis sativa]KAF4402916.1 hypothetical protein G4B88_010368 [Cannabis sativa]
MKRKRV